MLNLWHLIMNQTTGIHWLSYACMSKACSKHVSRLQHLCLDPADVVFKNTTYSYNSFKSYHTVVMLLYLLELLDIHKPMGNVVKCYCCMTKTIVICVHNVCLIQYLVPGLQPCHVTKMLVSICKKHMGIVAWNRKRLPRILLETKNS